MADAMPSRSRSLLGAASLAVTTLLFLGWAAVGLVHALGHLVAARVLRVPATFSLGVGPWVGTLGGVRISALAGAFVAPRLDAVGPLRAALYLLAGPLTSLAAAWAFVALPYGGAALVGESDQPAIVGHVTAGSPAARAGILAGDRVVAVDGAPAAWWSDLAPALARTGAFPVTVDRAGSRRELSLDVPPGEAPGLVSRHVPSVVGEVLPGSPAEAAGLRAGDVVERIDGQPITDWTEVTRTVAGSDGGPLHFEVRRGGFPMALTVTPEVVSEALPGSARPHPRVGLAVREDGWTEAPWENRTRTLAEAASLGSARAADVLGHVLETLGEAATPEVETLGGPVAIFRETRAQRAPRWAALKAAGMVLAAHSLVLGLYNLLPLAWSDGFTALDELARRALGRRLPHRLLVVGTVGILVATFLLVLALDLKRALAG